MKRFVIGGVGIDGTTLEEIDQIVSKSVEGRHKIQIATVNNEFVVEAQSNSLFKDILNKAEIRTIDSVGVERAIKAKYKQKVERITGVDLFYHLCDLAEQKGYKIYLLGGDEGVGAKTVEKLESIFPKIKIVGFTDGLIIPSGYGPTKVIEDINKSGANMLFVALGAPKQELWIQANRNDLYPCVLMGVGGTFDYVSGTVKRANPKMRKLGLEWLVRLFTQPKRFKRIMKAVFVFPVIAFFDRFSKER